MRIVVLGLCVLLCACSARREPEPALRDVAQQAGLTFRHESGSSGKFYLPEIMGSGAAVFDYDSDGDLDVYLVQGPAKSGSRLFRNETVPSGTLRFTDVTEQSGAGIIGPGMGAAAADYDNDGYVDLYVTSFGANTLLRNNGNGTFSNVTQRAGVSDERWSTSAAFLDYDRDGRLDLFVGEYLNYTVAANKPCFAPTGEPDYCNPSIYQGIPSRLFHNNGDGTFTDLTSASGIGSASGKALGVVCFDYDADGWIDIYVADDGVANHLWHNKHGVFEDVALLSGVAYNSDGRAQAGMGVDAADFDDDGAEDLFVTNLIHETNNLFRNDGHGNFVDASAPFGLGPVSRLFTGFGTRFADFDHDGRLDVFVVNGAVTRVEAQRGSAYPFRQPNQLFLNRGDRFEESLRFAVEDVGRGAAVGDLDNDGDLDVIVTNNNGPVRLLLNENGQRVPSLQVRLEGVRANRQGLGARVAVLRAGKPALWRRSHTDGSYLSASDSRVHFGLGDAPAHTAIAVHWPDGSREKWPAAPGGKLFITLRQGTGTPEP